MSETQKDLFIGTGILLLLGLIAVIILSFRLSFRISDLEFEAELAHRRSEDNAALILEMAEFVGKMLREPTPEPEMSLEPQRTLIISAVPYVDTAALYRGKIACMQTQDVSWEILNRACNRFYCEADPNCVIAED